MSNRSIRQAGPQCHWDVAVKSFVHPSEPPSEWLPSVWVGWESPGDNKTDGEPPRLAIDAFVVGCYRNYAPHKTVAVAKPLGGTIEWFVSR